MKVYTLDIDSSQRDANLYTYANNYVVSLENPVYDVSKISLVSARIPTQQLTVCSTNKTFSVDGTDITLTEKNVSNKTTFASELQTALAPPTTNVNSVSYVSGLDTLLFSNTIKEGHFTLEFYSGTHGYSSNITDRTTPHQIMGFNSDDFNSNANYQVMSGPLNFSGPNALVLRLTAGSDDFTKHVYTGTPFYTGQLLLDGSDYVNFKGADDPLVHEFHSGPQKVMDSLRVEFFYMSHGKLIPYDFRYQEHTLKFEITCSTDRLENLPREVIPEEFTLPPPIRVHEKKSVKEDMYKWVPIIFIVIVGILLMTFIGRPQPRTPAASVASPSGST